LKVPFDSPRLHQIFAKQKFGAPSKVEGLSLFVLRLAKNLLCADDSFYVGSAQDLDNRVKAHNDGQGATHTFKHRRIHLVYSEGFDSETAAVARERQLKRWSHKKETGAGGGKFPTVEGSKQKSFLAQRMKTGPVVPYRNAPPSLPLLSLTCHLPFPQSLFGRALSSRDKSPLSNVSSHRRILGSTSVIASSTKRALPMHESITEYKRLRGNLRPFWQFILAPESQVIVVEREEK